jgi:hypothetical protein
MEHIKTKQLSKDKMSLPSLELEALPQTGLKYTPDADFIKQLE